MILQLFETEFADISVLLSAMLANISRDSNSWFNELVSDWFISVVPVSDGEILHGLRYQMD